MMKKANNKGFTLVELIVSLAVSVIVIASVYATYTLQRNSSAAQDHVVEMQQNLRAGLVLFKQEVRMAGYNPTLKTKHRSCDATGSAKKVMPGVHTATATEFGFSMDLDQDGRCSSDSENVTYSLYDLSDGVQKLGRSNPDANEAVTDNIERIEFLYTLDDGTQLTTPSATQIRKIIRVTVSMLARVGTQDVKYVNNTVYTPASGANWAVNGKALNEAPEDNFRRRMVITTFDCRNLRI